MGYFHEKYLWNALELNNLDLFLCLHKQTGNVFTSMLVMVAYKSCKFLIIPHGNQQPVTYAVHKYLDGIN